MEPDQETRALPGDAGSSRVVMEEFVMGDHTRLVDSMRLAKELSASSRFFAKLSELFTSDAAFREVLACVRGDGGEPLRVVAYGLGGTQYSWAPRFRLAVLLLLRDTFPEAVGPVEVVCPTVAPVERQALELLGCVVSASAVPCRPVQEPTLIFMPYADRVFFENLLILNWSAEQLGKIILLGQSFNAMVKMLELSMSKQEKFGVTVQREKVRRVLAIQKFVREIELCADFGGLFDNPLLGDGPDPFQKKDEDPDEVVEDQSDCLDCICMHCVALLESRAMITALPSCFSIHLFHLDAEIDMEGLVPDNCTSRIWTAVNIQVNYDVQLLGWHFNPSDAYIEDKNLKEAESIIKELRETMLDVRSSSLYKEFIDHLKENQSIRDRVSSMLGAHDRMELVIYGLGSFEFNVKSQYQLAFALLLKEDNIFPVDDMEIYDPALSPADVMACFNLGIKVLLVNEQCRRSVEKPTLFFIPGLKFTGNLIESNFSPKQLNKMILVSWGLKDSGKGISGALESMGCGFTCSMGSLALERDRFLWASTDYMHEVIAMDNFQEGLYAVSELKFEFLEVPDDMDIYVKLPRFSLKEKFYFDFGLEMEYNSSLAFDHVASLHMQLEQRISRPFREDECECKDDDPRFWGQVFCHRLPEMNRTTWSPPPKGWIKLNFHGIGCSNCCPASVGGIFHNDKGEVLSYYAGPIGDVDQIVANSKALEIGLERMIEHHEPVYKLIIEGDNLSVIRWCNRLTYPPEKAKESFMRSFWLMDLRPCKETEAPATAEATEECNEKEGKDENVGSKDKHEDDDSKDQGEDDGASQGASSDFVIPPGWASREYIAWRIEEVANQVAVGLASLGRYLPEFIDHLSTICDCGHGMDMMKDKPDITRFFHDLDEDLVKRLKI